MRYERHLHWASCFLILTGFLSILITNAYSVVCLIGILFTSLYWLYQDRLAQIISIPTFVYNIVALVALLYLGFDGLFGKLDLIGNAIMFVVLLQIIKLLAPKTSRDWIQIYALSFTHIVASTALATDVTFVLPFVAYLFLATWTLALFTIRKQLEDTVSPQERARRLATLMSSTRLIRKGFFLGTGALTCIILIVGLLIFFMFPRLSFKNFIKRSAKKETIAGFSSEIELGTIGTIKTNEAIVLRAEVPENLINEIDVEELYWRGTASDYFDGRKWKQTLTDSQRIAIDLDSPFLDLSRPRTTRAKRFHYTVFMESLTTPMLFTLDGTYRITWEKPMIERFLRNAFLLEQNAYYNSINFVNNDRFATDLTFKAEADISLHKSELQGSPKEQVKAQNPVFLSAYLQLPDLTASVENVIRGMAPDRTSPRQTAQSLIDFLERQYRYTLAVEDRGTQDPLSHFFIDRREGHCEYFATALIVALRYYGIPSRMVMGFRGGEINYYGHYIVVRQKDAHSWVEAYLPDRGWVRLDPSPADSVFRRQDIEFLRPFYQLMDYARLRWTKYILDYDLRAQASFLERLGRRMGKYLPRRGKTETIAEDDTSSPESGPRKPASWAPVIKGLMLGGALLALWRFLSRRRRRLTHGSYADVLRVLSPLKVVRGPSETPRELKVRLEHQWGEIPELEELNRMYYKGRYAQAPDPGSAWQDALQSLAKRVQTQKRLAQQRQRQR